MRDAVKRLGGDPKKINPLVPVDLVIDHSVQVDFFGSELALQRNAEVEFDRNRERYEFLRWGAQAFDNLRIVPPATGIVHQVNLEYLARGVLTKLDAEGNPVAMPDTLVGTDSHTTMINGLGVLGWGVGGIEAEAVMLGQPLYMVAPQVVGFKLHGSLRDGVTATDLALTVMQMLRKKGVVDKFVEFYGSGLSSMSLPDRATIANMAPEYGATMGFFPTDDETLRYLRRTGRGEAADLVERVRQGPGPVPHRRHARPRVHRHAGAEPGRRGAQPGRPQAPAGPRAHARAEDVVPQGPDRARHRARLWPRRRPAQGQRSTLADNGHSHRDAARRGRHRRHHLLHQHQQPIGDDRRRPAGPKRRSRPVSRSSPTSRPAWPPAPRWCTNI